MIRHVFFKELKDSFRDRKTIFLSVILPILFSIGIVFFFDHFLFSEGSDEGITILINETADEQVLDWIETSDEFSFEFKEDPLKAVKEGEALVGMIIDEDFSMLLAEEASPNITFYIDPTSSKASNAAYDLADILFEKQSAFISQNLLEANIDPSVLEPFAVHVESITGEENAFGLYTITILVQMIILISVLVGGLPAATDLFAGEKERNTMEALLMTPVKRIHILVGKWLTISTLNIMSGIFSVLSLVIVIQFFTTHLKEALDLSNHLTYFVGGLSAGIIVFSLLIAALQMILSIIARTVKEAQSYITPITFLAMIPYFLLVDISPYEMTTTYFIIPFMNVTALIKQLVYGVYEMTNILLVVGSSAVFIAIIFAIGAFMFSKSKWVLGRS